MDDLGSLVKAARDAFRGRDWVAARDGFHAVRDLGSLGADDYFELAEAAWWLGDIDESLADYERAYQGYLQASRLPRAAMAAMFLAAHATERGDRSIGSGWMGRVHRLLSDQPESVEHGYPIYFDLFAAMARGDLEGAVARGRQMQELGRRFGDPNLVALGVLGEGRALLKQGRIDGMGLLDEAMTAAFSDELHPIWAGGIYCHMMDACHELVDLRRAGEWTQATARWCERFPEAVVYRGICRVHRAQVLQVQGDWDEAETEAARASTELVGVFASAVAEGHYQVGEVHRLRGDLTRAEDDYRSAHQLGRDPQPGLALVRLAEGRVKAASASIRAALAAENQDRLRRARLCAAQVEVALAAEEWEAAHAASDELAATAKAYASPGLTAASLQAAGSVLLADGQVPDALPVLRRACRQWQELGAPYDAAKTRLLLAQAYRVLGDEDAAALELDAAGMMFERLGASPDVRTVARLRSGSTLTGGLTEREAQVLRLVAAGQTNREIAAVLVLSDKTVARHLANIFAKLGLSSRNAVTAYAFEQGLASPTRG